MFDRAIKKLDLQKIIRERFESLAKTQYVN